MIKFAKHKALIALPLFAAMPFANAMAAEENAPVAAPEVAAPAVEQLRHAIGEWDVKTELISAKGEIYPVDGTYSFRWVVEDKIVSGIAETPAFKQTSAILFFHQPSEKKIEMVSVGPDGQLWRMIGPEDSEVRTTQNVKQADGSQMMLRFTPA